MKSIKQKQFCVPGVCESGNEFRQPGGEFYQLLNHPLIQQRRAKNYCFVISKNINSYSDSATPHIESNES